MKNLLSMLAVSTLVGTSASNLKPAFTSNVASYGFKSNQLNNKDISITNENDKNPFSCKKIENKFNKESVTTSEIAPNGDIYVGAYSGLYKSTDGINFNQVTSGLDTSTTFISAITIQPNGTIWVGGYSGLYKSIDDGKSFTLIKRINENPAILNILVIPSGNIYIATSEKGLYKSTDGVNFKQVNGIDNNSIVSSIALAPNGDIYVGAYSGLYKSTDGINFNQVNGIDNNMTISSYITIQPNGTIWVGTYKNGLWKSTDGIKFEQVKGIANNSIVRIIKFLSHDIIYIGVNNQLMKSTDGIKFEQVTNVIPNQIWTIIIASNGTIWIGTENDGLYIINSINSLLKITKPDTFDKSWPLYNGIVYNSAQKIDIKENLVAIATLDNKSITIPTTDLDIPSGEHNLVLTLKDKTLASVFGGDPNTGQVTYKLWVKTAIDKKDIKYSTNTDDTELYTGLVSNAGNTNGVDIIQTKNKNISVHQATLNSKFDDILIDYPNSYYVQGTVDDATNDFTVTGSKQVVSKNLSIKTDGIYHLHLEDTVGNIYDSYLELGESNWKLKGTFNDSELDKLKAKLNVTVNITDSTQKSKALGWLHQYDNFVENQFNETIKTNGKGFDSEIKNLITSYTAFLKPLTYDIANEPKFDDGLYKDLLVKTITDKANEILNKGLDTLPKNLNVNTKNVVNKLTLSNYKNWINNYQEFINQNKDKWINDITKIASRGFATAEQENQIKEKISQFLNNDNIKNYLKSVVWEDNKLLKSTSNDYQQYIELDKLQSDTIDWVNTNMKEINITYQNAIKNAESGLNLHGYSIDEILNGKQKPQTKNEIDNFADGQSYHEWLQSQANIKFHGWQLKIGLPIGLISLVVAVVAGCFIYRRTNPKYNPFARVRKLNKQDKKTEVKKAKDIKKEKKELIKKEMNRKQLAYYILNFVKLNPKKNKYPNFNKYDLNSFLIIQNQFK